MGNQAVIRIRRGRRQRWLLMGLLFMMVVGCAGTASRSALPADAGFTHDKARIPSRPKIAASATRADDPPGVEQRLRSEVRQWEGTPHRMGGATRQGIDCSGFVQRLYRDIFGRRIPRSTALQAKSGRPVGQNRLRTGDLVFFKVPHKGRHVGIYLGHAQFAHASTSRGVTISSLDNPYWRRLYWTARRYLTAAN
jgi:cell wall-associated NlpC family hydrolase